MSRFDLTYNSLAASLLEADQVDVGEWHAQDVSGVDQLVTRELRNVIVEYDVPHFLTTLQEEVQPNQPFADAQFKDRVSRQPLNPPPSADLWPYKQKGHEDHLKDGKFSHTYPERFWPKYAGDHWYDDSGADRPSRRGIRYDYGDLQNVVDMISNSPYTRQAYLPVWFPEDTGNQGVRLPCSLGYHFMLREGKMHCTYFIRSVDFVRHFRDDLYMAARLLQWVLSQLRTDQGDPYFEDPWGAISPGTLTMHMISLHCMQGDTHKIKRELVLAENNQD